MSARQNDSDLMLGDMEMIFDDDSENIDVDSAFAENEDKTHSGGNDGNDNPNRNRSGTDEQANGRSGETRFSAESNLQSQPSPAVPSLASMGIETGGEEGKIHSWDAEAAEKGVRQTMILEM